MLNLIPACIGREIKIMERFMLKYETVPKNIAALIPKIQLKITKGNIKEFQDGIELLENQLKKCPNIRETDGMKEHPAIFHYFYGSTDIFICEYDKKDYMFGFAILNGDLRFSEWGHFDLKYLTNTLLYNIDYHFKETSIEAALYEAYPNYYKNPQSEN